MSDQKENKKRENFQNPIDPDKITENPHSIEYAHHVGSALIKPEDIGKQKGRALTAMEHQTDQQLNLLYEQMQVLSAQAKKINKRKEISERIYQASFRFDPIVNHIYHLYEEEDLTQILSIIAPTEWGRSRKNNYTFVATIRLLGDHTWEILESAESEEAEES